MRAARALRKEQTEAEMHLWDLLRNRNFEGIKFRRQHPIKEYIVDFFSYEIKLVIELDSSYHNHPDQKEKDELRDAHLRALGYRVLRYYNETALNEVDVIYRDILERKKTFKSLTNESVNNLPSPEGEGLGMRRKVRLLSTKKLKPNQRELLLNAGVSFVAYDAIEIKSIPFEIPEDAENIIITSQNGAQIAINKLKGLPSPRDLSPTREARPRGRHGVRYFCVGQKTATLLSENGIKVTKTAQNASELAHFIVKNHKNEQFAYFCGAQRREELPAILKEARISCNEVVTYETHPNEQTFQQSFDGILFFSPSGVQSYVKSNDQLPSPRGIISDERGTTERKTQEVRCFCIGETTASEARKYFETVVVSNATTIESTIAKAVNDLAVGS